MKVLVTGASGLLGGRTALALAARGDEVTVFQRRPSGLGLRERLGDLTDPAAVRSAAGGVDAVVHLAAKVHVVGAWADYLAVNVEGTRAVVEGARAAGAGRLVQVSSPSVAHAGSSLVGAGAGPADPDRARGPYSRSKAMAEQIVLAAHDESFAVIAVRPHLVWGPGDTQLVGRIVARARAGRLSLVGQGTALIDTTYLDNAVDALVAALDAAPTAGGQPYVVSNGQPRPVAEILTAICRAAGVRGPRVKVPYAAAWAAGAVVDTWWSARRREDDPPITRFLAEQLATAHWFDQRSTRDALGWVPRVGIDEGFERLAAFYGESGAR
ncbi:MAG TPA: NAD-dependent epimerase/dehydratase family protein [Candidatus Limnocylindria bacterium]|nr:NAD-dependent epimerase/dehydratase family protein [Candidatus Limnocylindria bacterium]